MYRTGWSVLRSGVAFHWQFGVQRPLKNRAVVVRDNPTGVDFVQQGKQCRTHTDFAVGDKPTGARKSFWQPLQIGLLINEIARFAEE